MPSFPYTPAQIVATGGEFFPEPIRFAYTAAALALAGGDLAIGPSYTIGSTSPADIRIQRLHRSVPITDKAGLPTKEHQVREQRVAEQIEAAFAALGSQVTDLSSIVAGLQQAQATATAAIQQAQATDAKVNLANSRTEPVAGLLTASSAGDITITAHNRVYGDGTTVAVDGGSVTGFAPGQFVRVYYVDAAHEGGAVAYQGTLDEIVQEGATHVIGGVTIPQLGEVPVVGAGTTPPGFVFDYAALYG